MNEQMFQELLALVQQGGQSAFWLAVLYMTKGWVGTILLFGGLGFAVSKIIGVIGSVVHTQKCNATECCTKISRFCNEHRAEHEGDV